MLKRNFLKFATLSVVPSVVLMDVIVRSDRKITLPTLNGFEEITISPSISFIPNANAQGYAYYSGGAYGQLAPNDQWRLHMAAVQQWQQQMQAWQMEYAWLQEQHRIRMEQIVKYYKSYQYVGDPNVWPHVESVYGFAKDQGETVFFGMNADKEHVAIKKTLGGASKVYDAVRNIAGEKIAQTTTGPQSSESLAKIQLPDGDFLDATAYVTNNGAMAVSDKKVTASNGKTGNLAKFHIGKDNQRYLVV